MGHLTKSRPRHLHRQTCAAQADYAAGVFASVVGVGARARGSG